MIADRPDAAYEVCVKFAPNCEGGQSNTVTSSVNGAVRTSSSFTSSSSSGSSNLSSANRNEANVNQRSNSSGRATSHGRASDQSSSSSNLNERTSSVNRNSLRNLGIGSSGSGSAQFDVNMARDSGESDGLGGFNNEDEYYDSLNSEDENDPNSHNNRTVVSSQFEPTEPGIIYPVIDRNFEETFEENRPVSNTTTFSTVVNGVKIKSLPGPRGDFERFNS